jgi:transcriptional regulator with XRE-family HTH domain
MKQPLNNLFEEIDDFFGSSPTVNQRAWGMINEFYHLILTYMEKNNITQADLARRLGKSRSAISQMFNKTPNISIKKMIEIAEALEIDIHIFSPQVQLNINEEVRCFQSKTQPISIPYTVDKWIIDTTIPGVSAEKNRYTNFQQGNLLLNALRYSNETFAN